MAISQPSRRALHPAVSILCWLIFAFITGLAAPPMLGILGGIMGLAYLAQLKALPDFIRLLKRSRWLLVSLLLLYAWSVNGAWIWPGLGNASPTFQGLAAGGERVARLALLLAALALLLSKLSSEDLVYGLYLLTRPFAVLGFDRRAFAVRLALAMGWVRSGKTKRKTDLLGALHAALNSEEGGPDEICFESRGIAWPDGVALAAMLVLLGVSL